MSRTPKTCKHVVKTQAEIAAFFGVAVQTVKEWRRNDMPGRPGRWGLLDIAVWKLGRVQQRAQPGGNGNGQVPTEPRHRRQYFQAERERLRYLTETGELIPRIEHERALPERSAWIVGVLESLGPILGPRVAGKTATIARRIIGDQCRKLRRDAYGDANHEQ